MLVNGALETTEKFCEYSTPYAMLFMNADE